MNEPRQYGRFELNDSLGRGGTAAVYRIQPSNSTEKAALKVPLSVSPADIEQFRKLAQRELTLTANIHFPGVVRILNSDNSEWPFLMIELCQGQTLNDIGQVHDIPTALNILSAIAINLEFLKTQDVIHGDLKPHNLFLPVDQVSMSGNSSFHLKLFDFSMGRRLNETESCRIGLGTLGYSAPETLVDNRSSFRSDLFSFGVIAYQLLTGTHPFLGGDNDPVAIRSRVCQDNPPMVHEVLPTLNEKLSNLINSLLAKVDVDRPSSGWEVCHQLRAAGATYPFERILHPKYVLHDYVNKFSESEDDLPAALSLTDDYRNRINYLSTNSRSRRLIISSNFSNGNLQYNGEQFEFLSNPVFSPQLRRETIKPFCTASFGVRRAYVQAAVAGSKDLWQHLVNKTSLSSVELNQPMLDLLQQFLRPTTIRRLSSVLAKRFEQIEDFTSATRLYLQAGNLDDAVRCAETVTNNQTPDYDIAKVIPLFGRVIDFGTLVDREFDVRNLLMARGDYLKSSGDAERALDAYQRIILLYEGHTPDALLAETYKDLGDLYKMRREPEAGLEALRRAMKIYESLGDELEISHTMNNLGNLHWLQGELPIALGQYRKALRIQKRLESWHDVASTVSNIGAIFGTLGRMDRSMSVMRMALALNRRLENPRESGRILNNLGYISYLTGDMPQAIDYLTESLEINRSIGSKKEILFNLENVGTMKVTAGQLADCLPYLNEGLTLSTELVDRPHQSIFNALIGQVLMRMGRISEASDHFARVRKSLVEYEDQSVAALLDCREGELRLIVGDVEGAKNIASELKDNYDRITHGAIRTAVTLFLSRLSLSDEEENAAWTKLDEMETDRERSTAKFNRVEALIEKGSTDTAGQEMLRLLPQLDGISQDLELPRLCNIAAELLIKNNDIERAGRYADQAHRLAKTSHLLPELITSLIHRGQLALINGDFEQCYQDYREALDLSRKIASSMTCDEDRAIYRNRRSTQLLVSEIKRLGSMMQKKTGRVSQPVP